MDELDEAGERLQEAPCLTAMAAATTNAMSTSTASTAATSTTITGSEDELLSGQLDLSLLGQHVVVELKTSNALPLLKYACSSRVMALPTSQLNAQRVSELVTHWETVQEKHGRTCCMQSKLR